MSASIIAPGEIPNATPEQLSPILLRLLECPQELLPDLASQSAAAIADLPEDSRPESYEGLIDVARFCVEDEPGWEVERRAKFIGGHPRIGAPLNAPTSELSEESRKEQMKGGQVDPATLERLARLNAIYEAKYPGLRFVTYVAGRSRAAVADEIESLLGDKVAALKDAKDLAKSEVRAHDTDEWQSELDRASDALWEIAVDRAGKLTAEAASKSDDGNTKALAQAAATQDADKTIGQDVPFLSLASFRMLVLSSPVLESFFKSDLTESFYLEPVERSQSGGAYAWHTAPSLPGAPRALPGASKESGSATSEATYSRDVTTGARGKVVGFLGNLLGEEGKAKMNQLADQVGQRLQTHTVTGPKPSFGRNSTLDGGRMDTQELREKEAESRRKAAEERKTSLGNRLFGALRAPAKTPSSQDLKADASASPATGSASDRGRTMEKQSSAASAKADKRISLRGSDLSTAGPAAAAEALRAAQQALLQERPAFVIDEVGDDEAEGEDGIEGAADVEELGDVVEEAQGGNEAEGLLSGREAQRAKELRSAPAQ
ncbi:Oxo-4-hydroxy-4-carboxy-5-ureidoimidazoline decarboxylase [Kalmanozyma brasiliensis GHG001]|uniref:Thermoresistant gluconokinase n=1 Tax=Kalmanozyma brasiliensis (strain GHG001) TaxID=1365824 RepID=V5F035_KALBG|nr:Oxo-4-hydroxy-4-carboxy-5-ureidoimidazoline decarboxylase [Kalmanozyma brasiliensis GHG001]EST09618.1 Oxo-4-hydroxy-4-carboxy-5-ureidoimidazoline decarboxylase [Kalmanozyma brasiliensis GHG001]